MQFSKRSVVKKCASSSHESIHMLLEKSQCRFIFLFFLFYIKNWRKLHVVCNLAEVLHYRESTFYYNYLHFTWYNIYKHGYNLMSFLFSTFICTPVGFSFFFFFFLPVLLGVYWFACSVLLRKTLFAWFFYCFAELNHSVLLFERNTGFKINLLFYCICFCLLCM